MSLPLLPKLHEDIRRKLDGFYTSQRIPHLLFHGSPGTGKRTLVYDFINTIYNGDKHKIKTNVMFVNCAHGKGIKFIRDELKFFAKTNIQGAQGIFFKTIVLFNADSLTIDAQSALRRCIEIFSYNTRVFIVVENKHKLLTPILSRFCEIYVPEYFDADGHLHNLHQYNLIQKYGTTHDQDLMRIQWFDSKLGRNPGIRTHLELTNIVTDAYEEGFSCLDLIKWMKQSGFGFDTDVKKAEIAIHFQKIKTEYRCEKLLMLYMLNRMFFHAM